ncbi:molybdopterin-guanine dinucleotide biosynthesis protein B [Tissierella pigra]|uniref:Molybdopterin-guanine dinucleotide biosynthesis protein B n=1 Tax=Tissierella pigra TaxID=2607614 RepID=A0A6N7Y278_9FIRM|nr:molybdopterin-guanine dinucleotide biosynthesis protein B [Tissierella pigra]MBU5425163.1 molybdopterin-guanine dinucleotide biosynthesis protein B [Tissierella pigra]MSU02954.1 molybdopterin-guanine dinucleotide biosynthesis protein B [Tissierella pigra]
MIPVFSVVGSKSNVGKTTVLCKIISELRNRGYRVGTIKHDVHGFEIDKPGKDTWLHAEAGANVVSISSPRKMAIIEQVEEEYTLDAVIEKIDNVDIIITEGYKNENKPKLEVFRKEVAEKLHSKDEELFGIITDKTFHKNIPQFDFTEIKEVVDLIEERFLRNKIN